MRVMWGPSSDSDLVGHRKVPVGLRSHPRRNKDHVLILAVAAGRNCSLFVTLEYTPTSWWTVTKAKAEGSFGSLPPPHFRARVECFQAQWWKVFLEEDGIPVTVLLSGSWGKDSMKWQEVCRRVPNRNRVCGLKKRVKKGTDIRTKGSKRVCPAGHGSDSQHSFATKSEFKTGMNYTKPCLVFSGMRKHDSSVDYQSVTCRENVGYSAK